VQEKSQETTLIVAESVENHLRSNEDHEDRKREHESFPFECDNHHAEGVDEEDACPYEQNGVDCQYSVPKTSHKGIIVYSVRYILESLDNDRKTLSHGVYVLLDSGCEV